jgi:beta-xylosidase
MFFFHQIGEQTVPGIYCRLRFVFTLVIISTISLFDLLLSCSKPTSSLPPQKTYTNPVGDISGIGDPFVLKHENTYYMYCTTNGEEGFRVWQSKNLVDWTDQSLAFDPSLQSEKWAIGDYWAPEVLFYDNQFYMTYSARDQNDDIWKIALAKSENPLGPFEDVRVPLIRRDYPCIDGHIFIDEDGTPYLFYSTIFQIYVQELSRLDLSPTGSLVFCIEPTQSWEERINEGPFILKNNDIYYMMYSANQYHDVNYGIGYTTSNSVGGPWQKYDGNPILSSQLDIQVSGPGHNSVTTSPDGREMFIVYHTHTNPDDPSGDRQPNIDRQYFENDTLKIIGPTRSPQPMPGGAW